MRRPHLAEDLVQGALARCCLKWARISGDHEPLAYVRQAVVNAYLSRLRTRPWLERSTAEPEDRAQPDDTAAVDVRLVLHEALATLTPRQKAVVVLPYFEDLTEKETALALGVSVGTVRSTPMSATFTAKDGSSYWGLCWRVAGVPGGGTFSVLRVDAGMYPSSGPNGAFTYYDASGKQDTP